MTTPATPPANSPTDLQQRVAQLRALRTVRRSPVGPPSSGATPTAERDGAAQGADRPARGEDPAPEFGGAGGRAPERAPTPAVPLTVSATAPRAAAADRREAPEEPADDPVDPEHDPVELVDPVAITFGDAAPRAPEPVTASHALVVRSRQREAESGELPRPLRHAQTPAPRASWIRADWGTELPPPPRPIGTEELQPTWQDRLRQQARLARVAVSQWIAPGTPAWRRWSLEGLGLALLGLVTWAVATAVLAPRTAPQTVVTPPPVRVEYAAPAALPPAAPAAGRPAGGPVPDWADSIAVPDEILRGNPSQVASRLGGGPPGRPEARRRPEATFAAPSAPPVAGGTGTQATAVLPLTPVLLRRIAGRDVLAYPLLESDRSRLAGTWAVPPACGSASVRLTGQLRNGALVGQEEGGVSGGWLYALAVPLARCGEAEGQIVSRTPATAADRQTLARDLGALGGDRLPQGHVFKPQDLREAVTAQVGGVRHVWGVFRSGLTTTQLLPAPPLPQMAFVAILENGRWKVVWSQTTGTSADLLAFAGLYAQRDGSPAALFAWRQPDATTVLQVLPSGTGWHLASRKPL